MAATTELIGVGKIRNDLRTLMERLATPEAMMAQQIEILEESERAIFEAHGGRYVQTGALRDSLTQSSADNAIRRQLGGTLEFGTGVWYAKFQRNIGGPSGKPRGRKRVGPNQVLRLTPAVRREAVARIRERLYEGLGE